MLVVAFNGSPRKNGNTAMLIREVFKELEKEGIKTELIQLAENPVRGCTACGKCFTMRNKRCAIESDMLNSCIEKMLAADGIILGSPVYFSTMTPELKALIDRAGMVARANNDMFKRKIGIAVVAERRAGSVLTFDTINNFFLISQMIIPGSSYWNMGVGMAPGEVKKDKEGMATMRTLGVNMAWLIKRVKE
ncbi:flavodoxin family protein [Candidatus Woesearchaeota archaeon CG08_land_8_20_14_0_20_47_9]|nr:MAG: FMN reductase [Candidatus Woesearchaeota archaeon CG1_02_47_18]PIN76720.1 MAG: FMN reductase [Candidatus Woesearchaeota archaeon CG10_big_fil_rev_8_21_14_0_10_47_5]PIO04044.1 MAG: flavodoxin family protein [Candidatus Woesearchaeota archaeon CG08_land_8_20_14_0_20_47_9]HII29946.1 flavodoxin family protein [Candidatus Woesearchaeota archaeon]